MGGGRGRGARQPQIDSASSSHIPPTSPSLSACAVDHSIVMYLMSPEGEFLEFFTQLMTAPEISDKIEKVIKTRAKKN
jgi:cytochrome oxidase Cu insertion factor (SCO1/SenC/PrrC family)